MDVRTRMDACEMLIRWGAQCCSTASSARCRHVPALAFLFSKFCFILAALLCGVALYYRTTNVWTLKNVGDALLSRWHPSRPIIFGAFHRVHTEQNVPGNYVVCFHWNEYFIDMFSDWYFHLLVTREKVIRNNANYKYIWWFISLLPPPPPSSW